MLKPLTRAESSRYTQTSRHAEVMAFVSALGTRNDPRLHITDFGESPEGRRLPLLVLSSEGVHTPAAARALGRPVVLIICGIHAGEVEGKEASLMLVRDLLDGHAAELLERLTLVVVPLFNPDGNDRIDAGHRRLNLPKLEGQLGPHSGVGTRTNAAGINLNRDYMRQESLEMQRLQTRVCQPWAAELTIDCHATNGSVHRYALTYDTPHTCMSGRAEPIAWMRQQLLPEVTRRMRSHTGLETFFYGNFLTDEGGHGAGWTTYTHHPRFGSNYRGLTNRCDLLLETYAYIPFEQRVYTTYQFLRETLQFVAERPEELSQLVARCALPPREVAVRYELHDEPHPVPILTREPRVLSGEPTIVQLPHRCRFVGSELVTRPLAYLVPAPVAALLRGHGLTLRTLERATGAQLQRATIEGIEREGSRSILESSLGEQQLQVSWRASERELPAGSLLVATEQPLGAIATYLCEPRSDDGLLAAGLLEELRLGAPFPVERVTALAE
jgi:hypothetical protein